MAAISVKGACDLHIHSGPDIGERIGNDVEIATVCRDAGMRAVAFKCHYDTTMMRAYYTEQMVEGIKVYGGIVLNQNVGGINPVAVDCALQFGAKLVWMPTFHSAWDMKVSGKPGANNQKYRHTVEPITVLDENGKLIDEVYDICELVKRHDAILCTSHLSPDESLKVIAAAHEVGLIKVVVTHPFFTPPAFTIDQLKQAVAMGAFVEFCTNALSPLPRAIDIRLYSEAVSQMGSDQFIIGSDCGHPRKTFPPEAIRTFAYTLHMLGVSERDLQAMMCHNYEKLIDF